MTSSYSNPTHDPEVLLMEFQNLANSVQVFLKAFPDSKNQTKCKLIFRASLRGALNLRAWVDDELLGRKREASSDEAEMLKSLCDQFQVYGDPSFRLSSFNRRQRTIAADCAELWLRTVQSDSKQAKFGLFSQIVGSSVPKGHTSYSWSNPKIASSLPASDCTGPDILLRMIVHTRAIEENLEFRRELLKEQVF